MNKKRCPLCGESFPGDTKHVCRGVEEIGDEDVGPEAETPEVAATETRMDEGGGTIRKFAGKPARSKDAKGSADDHAEGAESIEAS